jgi:hypothetical protein
LSAPKRATPAPDTLTTRDGDVAGRVRQSCCVSPSGLAPSPRRRLPRPTSPFPTPPHPPARVWPRAAWRPHMTPRDQRRRSGTRPQPQCLLSRTRRDRKTFGRCRSRDTPAARGAQRTTAGQHTTLCGSVPRDVPRPTCPAVDLVRRWGTRPRGCLMCETILWISVACARNHTCEPTRDCGLAPDFVIR